MKIHSGIASGQVLQRLGKHGAAAILQGEARLTGPLTATLSQSKKVVKGWENRLVGYVRKGVFRFRLTGIPPGGPYRLTLQCGREKVSVNSVFVGDVWLLAGQSNMYGVGNLSGRAKSHRLVRAFSMRREWRLAKDPLHIRTESPDVCHHKGQQCSRNEAEIERRGIKGTGPGVFFAREMLARTGVPQGLICTAHGGTNMRQWNPSEKGKHGASFYASMLASVAATGQPVAGMLWYQGESDTGPPAVSRYTTRMIKLVRSVRRDLRLPRLPWVMAQLARRFSMPGSDARFWNSIQEQQRLLSEGIQNLETVATIDLPMDDHIHVGAAGFPQLGTRMAHAMLGILSETGIRRIRPPRIRKIRSHSCKESGALLVDVEFDRIGGSLVSAGEPTGFSIMDATGKPLSIIYRMTLHNNIARLHLGGLPVSGKMKIGYGLGFCPVCNIMDSRGFSLPVFGPLPLGK